MRDRVPERLRVKREPQRARYDRETVDAILDEALICHLGFAVDGRPYVIPTLHARVGDRLYVHGSAASRMLRHVATGAEVCVTVTLFDGLVLARSVFNHSVDYRSAMVFGRATLVEGDEKVAALRALTEQLAPGRWDEARQPTAKELKATWILSLPLDEASAKVRTGGPLDDEEDYALPAWAGVIPLTTRPGTPEPDTRLADGTAVPEHVSGYSRSPRPRR